jgi:Brp/Blh family beta-carotene 15,15'-monooxygenase
MQHLPPQAYTMNLKAQGRLFSGVAWAALLALPLLPHLSTEVQLLLLSPIILLFGVPHGALDIVFARQFLGLRSIANWTLFALAYVACTALVVGLWWISPGFFLAAFLLISIFHFSGDPEGDTPALFRMLYGGSVILCPLLLHQAQVFDVFTFLSGAANAQMIVALLQWAAWPWLVAMVAVAIYGAKQEPTRSVELVSVAALLTLAPPLWGFTLFFCAMHSARHVLRTRDYAYAGTLRTLLGIASLPMAITVAGVAVAWWLSDGIPLDMRLAQLLFVGLAALTVPHMILVEQVRWSGWMAGRKVAPKGDGVAAE